MDGVHAHAALLPRRRDAVSDTGEYDVLARVDDSDGCSVKDSWSRLDLSMEDFARLVVGEWVWLDPSGPAMRLLPAGGNA